MKIKFKKRPKINIQNGIIQNIIDKTYTSYQKEKIIKKLMNISFLIR